MKMPVARLLAELDSDELAEWEAYDRLEPIDIAKRMELAIAINTMTFASAHRDKNADRPKASDYMMDWGAEYRAAIGISEEGTIQREIAIKGIEAGLEALEAAL